MYGYSILISNVWVFYSLMHSATVCLLQELVFCILEGIDLANGHDWDICVA